MIENYEGMRVSRLLIWSAAVAALGVGAPLAYSQISITQECAKLEAEKKFDEAYEQRCGHGKMLKEGSNVYTVYQLHAQKKFDLIEKKTKDDLAALQKDGTCLDDKNETFDKCKDRLKRAAIDARVQARKNLTEHNRGRVDLMDEKDEIHVERAGGAAGATPGKTTILKDFKDAASARDPREVLGAGTKSVSFGEGIVNADKLEKVKGEDIEKLNPGVAAMNPDQKILEAVSTEGVVDSKFGGVFKNKKAADLRSAAQQDQADLGRAKDPKVRVGADSLSTEAFDAVIKELDDKANEENRGKKGTDVRNLEERDVDQGIEKSKDPKNPNAKGLDGLILDDFTR